MQLVLRHSRLSLPPLLAEPPPPPVPAGAPEVTSEPATQGRGGALRSLPSEVCRDRGGGWREGDERHKMDGADKENQQGNARSLSAKCEIFCMEPLLFYVFATIYFGYPPMSLSW